MIGEYVKPKIEVWINDRRSGINVHVQAVTENGTIIHFNQSGFNSDDSAMNKAFRVAGQMRKKLGAPANHLEEI